MLRPHFNGSDITRFPLHEEYLKRYGIGRSDPSKDPYWGQKERPWWPMRYFMDDWILAVWVYRIRDRERCEVGLFLAEDHTRYVKDSGIKGGLISLLTQAFHLLGKMEVCFVGPKPGQNPTLATGFEPEIPESLRRVARAYGVSFRHRAMIADEEGRHLYARLTGFSEGTLTEFRRRGIDPTRACFVVQRDIWSFEHVEYLLRNAYAPERLFSGGASPVERLSFQYDFLVLRTALMEERLRIVLEKFSGNGMATMEAKWRSPTTVRYTSDTDLTIPAFGGRRIVVKAGAPFAVTLIPRSAQGYAAFQQEDLTDNNLTRPRVVAVTKDFEWSGISPEAQPRTLLIPLFDTLSDLDLEIGRRLGQAVSTRSELSEHHD